ncbi:MAG: type II secretion system protein GspM [Myxococcota bacterium]
MSTLRSKIEAMRFAFERLSQREQLLVVGIGTGAAFLILIVTGLLISGAISKAEHRVSSKTDSLNEVLALQGEYKAREEEQKRKIERLRSNRNVRLVSLVEASAKQAGVEIGRLQPEEGKPDENGVVESKVELRAINLSPDRMQDFLNRIESAPGVVVIQRMKLTKPFRKDTLEIELVVTTYKIQS